MNSIIVVEGKDELHVIGWYLTHVLSYQRIIIPSNQGVTPPYYLPKSSFQDVAPDFFRSGSDPNSVVTIFSCGGVAKFPQACAVLADFSEIKGKEAFQRLFVVQDRDHNQESTQLAEIRDKILAAFTHQPTPISPASLTLAPHGATPLTLEFSEDDDPPTLEDQFQVEIIPMLLPQSGNGALEHMLLDMMCNQNNPNRSAHQKILQEATIYLNTLAPNQQTTVPPYLKKERERTKGLLTAVLAATNPTHFIGDYEGVLFAQNWGSNPEMRTQFAGFHTYL